MGSDQADHTLEMVRSLKVKAMEILGQAQGAGDLKTALLGIREARGCLELEFKAEGRLQDRIAMRIQAEVKPVTYVDTLTEEEADKKILGLLPYLVAEYGNLNEVIQYCRRYRQDDMLGEEVEISQ
jgi:hypothetical protein